MTGLQAPRTAPPGLLEAGIQAIAARQHGVVTRVQLLEAGLTPEMLDWRIESGRLRRLHRGVYWTGPILLPRAREMAAVLACGPATLVSHWTAGRMWQLASRRRGRSSFT